MADLEREREREEPDMELAVFGFYFPDTNQHE